MADAQGFIECLPAIVPQGGDAGLCEIAMPTAPGRNLVIRLGGEGDATAALALASANPTPAKA